MPMVPSGSCTDCYWWNLQKRQWIRINEDANVEVYESMTFLNGKLCSVFTNILSAEMACILIQLFLLFPTLPLLLFETSKQRK